MMEDLKRFGAFLRGEREARSITIEELSRKTRIPAPRLESLEMGRLDDLPARVYVRGFIKACAREIGVPARDLLHRFDDATRTLDGHVVAAQAQAHARDAADRPWWMRRSVGVAIGLSIALIVAVATLTSSGPSEASRESMGRDQATPRGAAVRPPARRL
jgi:cytoskeletal protein RodZ